ncbi:MAG: hypothetical protein ACRCSF_13185 [Mycobacteriaceae bacterium]
MTDVINPQHYYEAATELFQIARSIEDAHADAARRLNSECSGMVGDDDSGKEWGREYEQQQGGFFGVGEKLPLAIHNYGRVLLQAGKNHAEAESQSTLGEGTPVVAPADPGEFWGACYALPRAVDPNINGLIDDFGLADKVGIRIANGDTEELGKAADIWRTLAIDPRGAWTNKINAIADRFDQLSGEEIDIIVEDLQELNSLVEEHAEQATALQHSVRDYKDSLHSMRDELEDLLKALAVELAVSAVIGIASSFVTFGVGALASSAKAAASVARYAKKIKDFIELTRRARPLVKNLDDLGEAALSQKLMSGFYGICEWS